MNDIKLIFDDVFTNNELVRSNLFDNTILDSIKQIIFNTYSQLNDSNNDHDTIKKQINEFLDTQIDKDYVCYTDSEVEYLKSKILFLESIPQPEQRTKEWYEFRKNRLTASDFYYVIDVTKSKTNDLILKKCDFEIPYISNNATSHGIKFEDLAIQIYETINKVKVLDFGCIPHPIIPYFGASPDGIISYESENKNYVGRMLEIKCPYSRKIDGVIKPEYYSQMQGQLEVCDLEYCDFLECDFQMFQSQNEYFNSDKEFKGIIIELFDTNHQKNIYHYLDKKYVDDKEYIEKWKNDTIEKIFENDALQYTKTTYWYLNKINIILVKRDRSYFNKNFIKIKQFWDKVLHYRKNGIDELVDAYKNKKPWTPKNDEVNFIN